MCVFVGNSEALIKSVNEEKDYEALKSARVCNKADKKTQHIAILIYFSF